MNLHKRIAQHLPDLKNVISDKECLAINRKDYAIGEAGPLMAFLQAVKTGFNPEGLADYELFSLALALSYTNLFSARTRIVSLSKGTDAIAGALHYSLWMRGRTTLPLSISGDPNQWIGTGPSSVKWLGTLVKPVAQGSTQRGCWAFADYRAEGAQALLQARVKSGGTGFARHASTADVAIQNPLSDSSLNCCFSAIGWGLVTHVG